MDSWRPAGPSAHEPLDESDVQAIDHLRDAYARLRNELGKVIVGQRDVIERLSICLFARGHLCSWAFRVWPRP